MAITHPDVSQAGRHAYHGDCVPGSQGVIRNQETFSVGVFVWVARPNGKGCKRGPVRVRVSGPFSAPDKVYAKAHEIVEALDAGTYIGPKTLGVKP